MLVKEPFTVRLATGWSACDSIRPMNLILVLILGVIAGTAAYFLTLRPDADSPKLILDDVAVPEPEPTQLKPPPHVRWPEVEETLAPPTEGLVARDRSLVTPRTLQSSVVRPALTPTPATPVATSVPATQSSATQPPATQPPATQAPATQPMPTTESATEQPPPPQPTSQPRDDCPSVLILRLC